MSDINEIYKLEEKMLKDRKQVIIEKMDCYHAYNGGEGTDVFLDFLKQHTSFKYGTVADFENFKKDYLLSFNDLKEFNCIYYETGSDVDELLYFGFGGNMFIVNEMQFYFDVYDCILEYDFDINVLNKFEAFVDAKFKECCY